MQHLNTLNDLILFACSEPDGKDAEKYRYLIRTDRNLSRKYQAIVKVKNYLSRIQIGPSDVVIKNIMGFSRALSVTNTRAAGSFGILLN